MNHIKVSMAFVFLATAVSAFAHYAEQKGPTESNVAVRLVRPLANKEAQFTGTVVKVEDRGTSCFVKVNFSNFTESRINPLDIDDAQQKGLSVKKSGSRAKRDCGLAVGDALSGVLVQAADGEIGLDG